MQGAQTVPDPCYQQGRRSALIVPAGVHTIGAPALPTCSSAPPNRGDQGKERNSVDFSPEAPELHHINNNNNNNNNNINTLIAIFVNRVIARCPSHMLDDGGPREHPILILSSRKLQQGILFGRSARFRSLASTLMGRGIEFPRRLAFSPPVVADRPDATALAPPEVLQRRTASSGNRRPQVLTSETLP